MAYDPICLELAKFFTDDFTPPFRDDEKAELAQAIQDAVEDWLQEHTR